MIDGTDSAFQSWNSLEEQLLPMTKEKEILLNESQMSLKKGNLSLDEYLRKFKNICDSLAAVKNPMDEINKVFKNLEMVTYPTAEAWIQKKEVISFKTMAKQNEVLTNDVNKQVSTDFDLENLQNLNRGSIEEGTNIAPNQEKITNNFNSFANASQ
ncbi:hypothetical protein Dsin_020999 [Dipteronia sinensis]|uniref:Uncharacterized protein n=1 Tax=Dipteronia sinensis TaxID=43782 RepID=A0AAE0E4B6_9ROSI|nr:hypothetical protein Dsin_020999 [Dipteronia sinensis]